MSRYPSHRGGQGRDRDAELAQTLCKLLEVPPPPIGPGLGTLRGCDVAPHQRRLTVARSPVQRMGRREKRLIASGPLVAVPERVTSEATSRESAASSAELPVRPGQVIADRYQIGALIGEGGMGVVCKATHVLLGTPVAVKLIRSDLSQDVEAVKRFIQE